MKFVNCTQHKVVLNNGTVYETDRTRETAASVEQTFTEFDENGIASQEFGGIKNLPDPEEGTIYIVGAIVLAAAKAAGRTDCVAPATGHPECRRDPAKPQNILSVPGLLR